jgi:hypothetical protein
MSKLDRRWKRRFYSSQSSALRARHSLIRQEEVPAVPVVVLAPDVSLHQGRQGGVPAEPLKTATPQAPDPTRKIA